MPTIEGKEGRLWIDEYVAKAGKMQGVLKGLRALVKKTIAESEEYVNPWKIPLKKLIVEAAKLNKREPMEGMKVDMNKRRRSKRQGSNEGKS